MCVHKGERGRYIVKSECCQGSSSEFPLTLWLLRLLAALCKKFHVNKADMGSGLNLVWLMLCNGLLEDVRVNLYEIDPISRHLVVT